jgi:hypothetical protein
MFKPGLRVVVVFGVTGAVVWSTAGSAISQDAGSAGSGPDVRISELTNGGPGGHLDNFVEIANFGDEVADLDGWAIYRCIGRANRFRDPQVPPLEDVRLAPGETYTIAHPDSTVTHLADRADAISSYANDGFGIVIEDADRNIVDAAAVYADTVHSDCTDRVPSNLPNDLDFQRAQSYQRVATTGDVQRDFIKAERTPGAPNATEPDPGVQPSDVRISELTNGGPRGSSDNFIELANFGDQPVDIGGWEVWRCRAPGYRLPTYLQVTVPDGVVLELAADDRQVVAPDSGLGPMMFPRDNAYFADGLMEEVIADLSRVQALTVISRTSSVKLKATDWDLRRIGRELNVGYALEGSVRRAGSNLRITAQLIDLDTQGEELVVA